MTMLESLCRQMAAIDRPDPEQIRHILQSLPFSEDFAATYATEPDKFPYGRNVLCRTPQFEAILIHLPAFAQTFIHDHGDSVGCAIVLEGTLLNEEFRLNADGQAEASAMHQVVGGNCFEAEAGLIHRMSNPSASRTVSFHVYAPPLQRARTYAQAKEVMLGQKS